ncbi:MAG: glucosidase [Myxococcales bacterium]
MAQQNPETRRLTEAREEGVSWRRWGPYLSERQWGTVREDYSPGGDAWGFLSHDQARSRVYHWGEDGLAGLSDDKQRLCFSLALWNGKDPILKERLFGLTNSQGNHGEDVKEYYYYLDCTPTHSYMKYLYKYPQREFPYNDLVSTNARRGKQELEYELMDTGVFADDRYFDVFVEYAKASPEDVLVKLTICNRGPERAAVQVLPTLWFRNTWLWWDGEPRPGLRKIAGPAGTSAIEATHAALGRRYLYCQGETPLLFTENETNNVRCYGSANRTAYVKDGINDHVVNGRPTVNPEGQGTKASARHALEIGAGQEVVLRLRLTDLSPEACERAFPGAKGGPLGRAFDEAFESRRREADEFYQGITPPGTDAEAAKILRQSLSGMLWTKQYYLFDVNRWLGEHGVDPFDPGSRGIRDRDWFHMVNDDIISMPDKWEYPWYAAWDLAYHTIALASVDPDFAKQQLVMMLRENYLHPSGQIPAYEWNFSDVNPPVHAWATLFVTNLLRARGQPVDYEFLAHAFGKLSMNFTWWVNRKDRLGNNAFEGGFLGLDNIGVFDRSSPLPTGGFLEQADGTAWMAFFCQNMLQMGTLLAERDPGYEDLATKFVDHFFWIALALNRVGDQGMWDEEDGFYYDVLRRPDGSSARLKVRSMVGLLPLCATTVIEREQRERVPRLLAHATSRAQQIPQIRESIHLTGPGHFGEQERGILALVNEQRLRRILTRVLDEREFLSPYGIRALSRFHAEHPYSYWAGGQEYRVGYVPGDSDSGMFGGNSNWRGPVWFPMNALIIRALMQFYLYYGDRFTIECPTGSGRTMNLFEVAHEIGNRLLGIFRRDASGRRPVFGGAAKFQTDPHWRDHLLFYEYFHGDNGAGIGASHQTGWTGLAGTLVQLFGMLDARSYLASSLGQPLAPARERRREPEAEAPGVGGP